MRRGGGDRSGAAQIRPQFGYSLSQTPVNEPSDRPEAGSCRRTNRTAAPAGHEANQTRKKGGRMQSSDLLEAIWRGDVARAGAGDTEARFAGLLDRLMPMRRIGLQRGDRPGGQVLPEDTELMPALPLGDVIEEELLLAAPRGALVVILDGAVLRPGAGDAARSQMAGRLVGELLIDAVQRGVFPAEQETDALYLLALSYDALARDAAMHRRGLVAAPFRAGLSMVLASFWTGRAVRGSEPDLLLNGPLFLSGPRLRDYLTRLDASFTAPDPALAEAALVSFEDGQRNHGDWLHQIADRVGRLRDRVPTAQDAPASKG